MHKIENALLNLLKKSIDKDSIDYKENLPLSLEEWDNLFDIAASHGVTGILYNIVSSLESNFKPPIDTLIEVYGETQNIKTKYDNIRTVANKYSSALSQKGVKFYVLKGISFSSYYDDPSLRPSGDCDCYLLNSENDSAFEIGNETAKELGALVDFGTYKHSHIRLDGVMIENHHYITEFNNTSKGIRNERILQKLILEGEDSVLEETTMYKPSGEFNAVFLVFHALNDFLAGGITLRMIYDWAILIKKEQNIIDWQKVNQILTTLEIKRFADVLTGLSAYYLGLNLTNNDISECNDQAFLHKVLLDTLRYGSHMVPNESFLRKCNRILKRFQRMWHYRDLAIESVPTMIWNSFAFSSYLNRDIHLKDA